jgi:hypothetical protein
VPGGGGATAEGITCLTVVVVVVTVVLVGDQSCGVVEVVVWSIVLSGMIGTGGGGAISLPPTGLYIGAAGLSLAIQCIGRATSHSRP